VNSHRLSVVIPIYNSSAILPALLDRLLPVLERIADQYEVILVNDGSPDASWETIIRELPRRPHVRGLRLSRNFGQHNALLCGVRAARFDTCLTMDDDLQHPPEEIPALLAKLDEGFDLVYGAPQRETHGAFRDHSSKMVKRAMRHVLGVRMAEAAGAFRCFRTRLRDAFADYRSPQVNLEVLLSWATTNLASVQVPHATRHSGQSGYTFRKLLNHTANLVLGYSTAPLRLANLLGFLIILFGIVVLMVVLGRYVVEGSSVPGFPFLASVMAIFSGVQLLSLGVIGEYIARIYTRTMERPAFVVAEEVRSP
jgi:glycosyltransferase involved in cell wall biosynthesis